MKLGVIETIQSGPTQGPGEGLRRLMRAEAQGYQGAWIRAAGDPARAADAGRSLFLAAWLAARSDSIAIGLWAPPPADLHPLRLAEDLAVLDQLSGGRLEWAPVGDDIGECLDIVMRSWSGEAFEHRGERYSFPELTCSPRPEQRPHPRLWLSSGVRAPALASPTHCGRMGEVDSAGRDAKSGEGHSEVPAVLVHPIEGDDPAVWHTELEELQRRFEPEWLLVWPGGGALDEDRAQEIQRLFAREVGPAHWGPSLSA